MTVFVSSTKSSSLPESNADVCMTNTADVENCI